MLGKVATTVSSCEMKRVNGETYVTLIPATTYDNSVKIIKITDS
jgi:hypothetical protein